MKAPEKIYLVIDPVWGSMSVNYNRNDTNNIEYARTDTFIEKAVNFLEMLGYGFTITDNITKSQYDNIQLIEDFKKYMKK